jgi:hypothetical protein
LVNTGRITAWAVKVGYRYWLRAAQCAIHSRSAAPKTYWALLLALTKLRDLLAHADQLMREQVQLLYIKKLKMFAPFMLGVMDCDE